VRINEITMYADDTDDLFVKLRALGSKQLANQKIHEMVKQNKLTVEEMDELVLRVWKSFTYPGEKE
jgi:hypothetical protein